jgi:hypothetical protein
VRAPAFGRPGPPECDLLDAGFANLLQARRRQLRLDSPEIHVEQPLEQPALCGRHLGVAQAARHERCRLPVFCGDHLRRRRHVEHHPGVL